MTMMSQSLELLAWSCLFLTVESRKGQETNKQKDAELCVSVVCYRLLPLTNISNVAIDCATVVPGTDVPPAWESLLSEEAPSPPQNVSLLWITGFQPQLSWAPSQHSGANCTYEVYLKTKRDIDRECQPNAVVKKVYYFVMEGGFLNMTVIAVCNGTSSEHAWVSVDNPELVSNLQCYIHSATQTYCSWEPSRRAPDLRFFYRILGKSIDDSVPIPLHECSTYNSSGGVRTGCDLEANIDKTIHILFNGTVNNTLATNTFMKNTADDVRLPPLHLTVTKTWDKFLISWTRPVIERLWTFRINYTECSETKIRDVAGVTSMELDRVPRCPYRIAIKAFVRKEGTSYSDVKDFAADTDPNAWLYAAIIIPVMLAGLAALVLVCCRKNKEYIFPKVPGPRDLLSDISDNNNKSGVTPFLIRGSYHNLYVPAEEDNNCKITLVVDPLINKLDI